MRRPLQPAERAEEVHVLAYHVGTVVPAFKCKNDEIADRVVLEHAVVVVIGESRHENFLEDRIPAIDVSQDRAREVAGSQNAELVAQVATRAAAIEHGSDRVDFNRIAGQAANDSRTASTAAQNRNANIPKRVFFLDETRERRP